MTAPDVPSLQLRGAYVLHAWLDVWSGHVQLQVAGSAPPPSEVHKWEDKGPVYLMKIDDSPSEPALDTGRTDPTPCSGCGGLAGECAPGEGCRYES